MSITKNPKDGRLERIILFFLGLAPSRHTLPCNDMSGTGVPVQPVDATQANLSVGVSNSDVSRGRSFSRRATLFSWA